MKPQSIWLPSPNFREATGRKVSCVVLHATATASLKSPLDWLTNPQSKVSAHYVIGTDGVLYHLVLDQNIAWHAGESEWRGQGHVNTFSVGIELVNANDGLMPYPEPQVAACCGLVKYLMAEFGVDADNVVRHADVAPGRKDDPLGFDMADFRKRLA